MKKFDREKKEKINFDMKFSTHTQIELKIDFSVSKEGRPKTINMYRKRTTNYMKYALSNKKSIAPGSTVVPVIVSLKKEKKSAKGNTYFILVVQTLNKSPVFVQFAALKQGGEKVSFQPATKRIKRESTEENSEPVEVEVPEDERITKQDGSYGTIVKPCSTLILTSFDRNGCVNLDRGMICKVSISADSYEDNINFKCNEVIMEPNTSTITKGVFQKYFMNSDMTVIPTKSNIDPESFPVGTDPKYFTRHFVLPLSDDTPLFKELEVLVDPEDSKRFYAKRKEDDKIVPSVNTEVGPDMVRNNLSVIYATDKEKFFFKYAYSPSVWNVFGICDLDKWSKTAGRMMFSAVNWYAYGSSKLDDIKSMRSNAEADDEGGLDFGYGGYGMDDMDEGEDEPAPDMRKAEDEGMISTTGYISNMTIDLKATAKKAGIELSSGWVSSKYGPEGNYNFSPEDTPNPLNSGWRSKLERDIASIFNFTEMDDFMRLPFIKEAEHKGNVKFYGIFAAGNDAPYENVNTDKPIEEFLDENSIMPATIFAVVE